MCLAYLSDSEPELLPDSDFELCDRELDVCLDSLSDSDLSSDPDWEPDFSDWESEELEFESDSLPELSLGDPWDSPIADSSLSSLGCSLFSEGSFISSSWKRKKKLILTGLVERN